MNFWIFGSSNECDHDWKKLKEFNKYPRQGGFDSETGEFEWVIRRRVDYECTKCDDRKRETEDVERFKYTPDKVEKIDT